MADDERSGERPASGTGTMTRVERRRLEREREKQEKRARRRSRPFWQELPILVVVAVVLAFLIKTLLVQAFYIPSESMERTLHGCDGCHGDRVLVNKLVYDFREPHRGEVIVFNGVDSWTPEVTVPPASNPVSAVVRAVGSAVGLGPPSEKDFIKRVIGLPGDTVQCCDAQGRVTVNGKPLSEPYVYQNNPIELRSFGPVTVPAGRLWVMGDHRGVSADSRSHIDDQWHGTIPEDRVIGRAFVIVWPPSRIAGLPVPHTFDQFAASSTAVAGTTAPALLGLAVAVPLRLRSRRRSRARRGRR